MIDSRRVQFHGPIRLVRKLVKPALAGWLAVLLLLTTTASASHLLHRALHGDSASANHNCVVCLFAKGQVTAADGVAMLAAFVAVLLFSIAWTSISVLTGQDFRLPPSRAPPAKRTLR